MVVGPAGRNRSDRQIRVVEFKHLAHVGVVPPERVVLHELLQFRSVTQSAFENVVTLRKAGSCQKAPRRLKDDVQSVVLHPKAIVPTG